jgi:protoheme IX farnesyltransferase
MRAQSDDDFALKLRIGVAIAAMRSPASRSRAGRGWRGGRSWARWRLGASGAAGAFSHYYGRDVDRLMRRTCAPFASGTFKPTPWWLVSFSDCSRHRSGLPRSPRQRRGLCLLGAFTYGIVYTVWLKQCAEHRGRRPCRFCGAGRAAAVDPSPQVIQPYWRLLFLWTPPHFWSLAA